MDKNAFIPKLESFYLSYLNFDSMFLSNFSKMNKKASFKKTPNPMAILKFYCSVFKFTISHTLEVSRD